MSFAVGVIAALGSSCLWAWSSTRFQPIVAKHGALACNMFKATLGTAFFVVALAILAGFTDVLHDLDARSTWALVASGVIGMSLGDWAYFATIQRLGVRQATLLHGTAPLFLLGFDRFGEEALGTGQIVGLILVVLGVLGVTLRRAEGTTERPARFRTGLMFGLLAALAQALGVQIASEPAHACDPLTVSTLRLGSASIGLFFLGAVGGRLRTMLSVFRDSATRIRAIEPVFLGTFLGVLTMSIAMGATPPAVAGALMSTTPIFVIPMSWWLLGEPVRGSTLFGTCVAALGVALISAA
ncbi:MAG: hypothetical protein CMJ83_22455 [Planctomycetes bacterium]|nr:hypothetical protein [Planctomycetota bacterium]